jgi:tetratricopeptide (TPR) repeat protein
MDLKILDVIKERGRHRSVDNTASDQQDTSTTSLELAMFNCAVKQHQDSRIESAEALYRAVLALQPGHAQAAYNLGVLFHGQHRLSEAVAAYRHAISVKQDYADAYCNLGVALQDERKLEEALATYSQAIAIRPDFAMAYCNLGVALKEVGQFDGSVAALRNAIALQPSYDFAYANLAATLLEQGKPEDAAVASRRALALNPDLVMAHFNLATGLKHLGSLDEAAVSFQKAIALSPGLVEAHFSLGQVFLLQGNFPAGWLEYEWRWRLKEYSWLSSIHGSFSQPLWAGDPLCGRTILLYAEQGLGDAIQFVRYVPKVIAAGGNVILAVHPPLRRLFANLLGITTVNLDSLSLPAFDVHCPLLSLPLIFGTTIETVPSTVPYLKLEQDTVVRWRNRIRGTNPRIGIVWAGNPAQTGDRFRSPGLGAVLPLFDVPDVSFVLLQVGPGRQDLIGRALPKNVQDLGSEITDLADTAAIMTGLDLVITSCTAPLHLAGALGIPTWAMISASPHFAWLVGRPDSVWYPSLRLYRQQTFGTDWSGVVAQISADLAHLYQCPEVVTRC